MKKILYLVAALPLLASVCFTSCKSDEPDSTVKELLIGTWKIDKEDVVIYKNGEVTSRITEDYTEAQESGVLNTMTFNSDGTFKMVLKENGVKDDVTEANWNLQDDKTIIVSNSTSPELVKWEIKTLDSKNLTIFYLRESEYDGVQYKYETTGYCTKL
ncbi:MAG: hypothetical protein LBB41_01375 [Prevotellaceae bacterium]|jgi:hypothetical protein|nr:hypothetical protein [Prevotellaceae bacterium]